MLNATVIVFRRDESGYSAWLADNPTGLVVNTRPTIPARYRVLHRSTCWMMQPGRQVGKPGACTERQYIKVCGPSARAIEAEIGPLSKRCTICGAV